MTQADETANASGPEADTTNAAPPPPPPGAQPSAGPAPEAPGAPAGPPAPAAVPEAAAAATPPPPPAGAQPAPGPPPAGPDGVPWQAGSPAPSGRKLGTGAILGIVGGGVGLLLVIILVVALVVVPLANQNSGGQPAAAVEQYITAIAEGDAETALSFIDDTLPLDRTLLTDEALAASAELAPITDIEVGEATVDTYTAIVPVTFLLGGTPVATEFELSDYDRDGEWLMYSATAEISLYALDGIDFTVNGVPVDGTSVEVFPGTYEIATTLERFTITGETTITVTEPGYVDAGTIEPALTDEAIEEFRAVVRAAVDACVASKTLTAGCGLDLPAVLSDGTQMTEGSITRTLPANTITTLESLEPRLSYSNPTLAQGEYIGSVNASGTCTKDGRTGTCSILFAPSLGIPSVNMVGDELTVLWD